MEAQEAVKQQELAMKEQLQQTPNGGLGAAGMVRLAEILQMDGTDPEISRTGRISICMDSRCQEVTDVWLHRADKKGVIT